MDASPHLLALHQNYCNQFSHYTNDKCSDILNALGGIEGVLTMILKSDIKLTDNQMAVLRQTMTATPTHIIHDPTMDVEEGESPKDFTYCFNRNGTFLNILFGDKHGQKLFNFVYSKIGVILIGLLGTFGVISYHSQTTD